MDQIDLQNNLKAFDFFRLAKQSLGMAWPIAGSRILVAFTNFFVMWLIASLGHRYLAAGSLIYVMQIFITAIMAAILFAISPLVSRAHGAGDDEKIGAVVQQGWLLSIFLTLPAIFLLWFAEPILLTLGEAPALAVIAGSYFHIYIFAVIPMFFLTTMQMLMMGVGKQRLSLISSLLSAFTMALVSYLLTKGKFGLPSLGVQGVAWGMVCGVWMNFFFLSFCVINFKFFDDFKLFHWRFSSSWAYLKQLFITGWPIVLQSGGELFSLFLITVFIGWLGESSLAANQIASQFNILIIIPMVGFSQASSILVGQAAGAKRYDEVRHLGWINMGLAVLVMLIVAIFYLGFPKLLIGIYIDVNNPAYTQTVHLATILFTISTFSLLFDNARNVAIGALRGVYDNRFPMYFSLALIWLLGMPLGYVLAFHFNFGVSGLALGSMIGIMLGCSILMWRWHYRLQHLIERAEQSDLSTKAQMHLK